MNLSNLHQLVLRTFTCMLPVVFAVLFTACSNEPPKDWVALQWEKVAETYHISPIYPPTEDVHVGDIYVRSADPLTEMLGENDDSQEADLATLGAAVRIDAVSMVEELQKYYRKFPVFPSTCIPPIRKGKSLPEDLECKGNTNDPQQDVFAPATKLTKLPLVALPDFTITQSRSLSGGLGLPFKFVKFLLFGSSQSEQALSVKVQAAEVYGVPAVPAYKALVNYCKNSRGACSTNFAKNMIIQQTGYEPDKMVVLMVNRLYLARSIEYTYDQESVIGGEGKALLEMQAQLAKEKAQAEEIIVQASNSDDAVSAAKSDAEASATKALTARIEALQKSIREQQAALEGSKIPSGTVNVAIANSNRISIVRTFERPIAIGYTAVQLAIPIPP